MSKHQYDLDAKLVAIVSIKADTRKSAVAKARAALQLCRLEMDDELRSYGVTSTEAYLDDELGPIVIAVNGVSV